MLRAEHTLQLNLFNTFNKGCEQLADDIFCALHDASHCCKCLPSPAENKTQTGSRTPRMFAAIAAYAVDRVQMTSFNASLCIVLAVSLYRIGWALSSILIEIKCLLCANIWPIH